MFFAKKVLGDYSVSQSQSQSQRLPRSSLPAADLTAEMETMAQRRGSMDDSFHLPNFPHMAWVDPSALPTIVMMPSLRARLECILSHRLYCTLVSQRVPHPSVISQRRYLTSIGWNVVVDDIEKKYLNPRGIQRPLTSYRKKHPKRCPRFCEPCYCCIQIHI